MRAAFAATDIAVDRRRRRKRFRLAGTPVTTAENGQPYDGFTVEATYGSTPYVYSAAGLPDGLSMNASTGEVSGTPTETGSFVVDVSARDAFYRFASIPTFTLVVS